MTSRPPTNRSGPRVLLLGAGHAHLHLLREARALVSAGLRVTVVSPEDFWYSGAATGVLAGVYPPGAVRIDVAALAEAGGVEVVRDAAVSADPVARSVRLGSGRTLGYDVLSVNVGSVPRRAPTGAHPRAVGVKPVTRLVELVGELRERVTDPAPTRVVVVGGGASGCEVALGIERRVRREGGTADITVITEDSVVPELPRGARRALRRVLASRGVRLLERTACRGIEDGLVRLGDGRTLPADVVVDATGLVPAPAAAALGVPVDQEGAIRVDAHLRSVGDDRVFAVGDCARFEPTPLARIGVHAVRQAPILLHNLGATVRGEPLRRYRPRSTHLLILALGDGTGLATWGPFWWRGRSAFRLKDWIDRRFLRRHSPGGRA